MNKYKIEEFQNTFNKLVKSANENKNNKNMIIVNKDKNIEFIYRIVSKYCLTKNIILSRSYLDAYVQIIYNCEKYGEKIYRIFCPWYGQIEFYIPDNIYNIECPIVNFSDVINYYKEENKKEQLKNIKILVNELLEQGLTKEDIESQIKIILYKEIENPKQKVKRPQK